MCVISLKIGMVYIFEMLFLMESSVLMKVGAILKCKTSMPHNQLFLNLVDGWVCTIALKVKNLCWKLFLGAAWEVQHLWSGQFVVLEAVARGPKCESM